MIMSTNEGTPRPTTDLSRRMGYALRGFIEERDITLDDIATVLGRSRGYVSERTTGVRELGMDVVYATAKLAHLTDDALLTEIYARMRQAEA